MAKKLSPDTCNLTVAILLASFKPSKDHYHVTINCTPAEFVGVKLVRRVAEDPKTNQKDLQDLEVAGKFVTEEAMWCP